MTMAKKWSEQYVLVKPIGAGGQGDAMVARAKIGGDDVFLKVLRHQNDMLRRKRMHREVEAYRTLVHPRIPRLVDSNSGLFNSLEHKLFLASDLVHGVTLREHVERVGPLSLTDSTMLVDALLDVISYCHLNQVVHRDIKPDNILLRGGAIHDPVLVDFGLSFDDRTDEHGTVHEEELGNRFLRLPELAGGSADKRDPRSDVTFAAGVFLYCLTAATPSVLVDEAGTLPHQRATVRERLAKSCGDTRCAVSRILDQAFQVKVEQRWPSADELRLAITALQRSTTGYEPLGRRIKRVMEMLAVPHRRDADVQVSKLRRGMSLIEMAMRSFATELGNLSVRETGMAIDIESRSASNSWALAPQAVAPNAFVRFDVEIVGDELTFSASYKDLRQDAFHRCLLREPYRDQAFDHKVKLLFLAQLEDLLAEPCGALH